EAELIAKAMHTYLWLPEAGTLAEFKDLLGHQLVHPSAGLWSFYHTIDSEVPTPAEARQMAMALQRAMPHMPVHGPGVPDDRPYFVLPETQWMPYSWSVNNVVMGENLHTALALWQAGDAEQAFTMAKGALLASMYMGICPGNVGTMNYLDVYRRESQRDFADGCGVMSRAIVQGLFGVKPDALAGELRISPGFPRDWNHATLTHPDVHVEFTREGLSDHWSVGSTSAAFRAIKLRVPAIRERVARVEINDVESKWRRDDDAVGGPRIELDLPGGRVSTAVIQWSGDAITPMTIARSMAPADEPVPAFDWRLPRPSAKCEPVDLSKTFNDRVSSIFAAGKYRSPRSPGDSLAIPSQGAGAWAGHVNELPAIDDTGLRNVAAKSGGRLVMPNGVPFATPGPGTSPNICFTSQWDNYPREVTMPLTGRASRAYLLMAGSTNFMQSRLDNGEVLVTYTDGLTSRLALRNPTTWWPIEQDYFIDDYQFRYDGSLPPRVNLKTGEIRLLDEQTFKGKGGPVPGGAATVLQLPLDAGKELQSLTVRTLANEVVIGLMAVTLERAEN
ncbi:MAG TPA: hypothetical protein VLI90_01255, partial [Tepidisphaeraceae bacterium]|nr:hypothetical protein [Tepidisphaeraceae bacterium]